LLAQAHEALLGKEGFQEVAIPSVLILDNVETQPEKVVWNPVN
jgi:hypothetical protein